MKKIIFLFVFIMFIATSFIACGGGGGGGGETPPPPPPVNNAPTIPTLLYPTNNLLCINNVLTFDWKASSDVDGDAISYQIQVAKDASFTQIEHALTVTTTSQNISLEKGLAYYWRVRAVDSKNLSSSFSTMNQFYTEGVGIVNYVPFIPTLVGPNVNALVQTSTVTLEWTASDVDTDDILTYDVYFGTENPPTEIVSSNQSESSLELSLDASQNYFWKVVVKDNNGAQAESSIWNFKTD